MQNKPIVMDGLKLQKKLNISELLRLNAIKLRCHILEFGVYRLVSVTKST